MAGIGGARSAFYVYPDDDLAIIILSNLAGGQPEQLIDTIAGFYIPALRQQRGGAYAAHLLRNSAASGGFDGLDKKLAAIRRQHGLSAPTEDDLNAWGYRLLGRQQLKQAVAVFQLGVQLYPQGANGHDSLAEAYEADGASAWPSRITAARWNWTPATSTPWRACACWLPTSGLPGSCSLAVLGTVQGQVGGQVLVGYAQGAQDFLREGDGRRAGRRDDALVGHGPGHVLVLGGARIARVHQVVGGIGSVAHGVEHAGLRQHARAVANAGQHHPLVAGGAQQADPGRAPCRFASGCRRTPSASRVRRAKSLPAPVAA